MVDWGLASILFVAPLFMGGRHPLGRLVFVSLAVLTALAWCIGQCLVRDGTWRRCSAIWVLLGGVVLLVLQLLPLPPQVLAILSPDLGQILPLWQTPQEGQPLLGVWSRISLTPTATRGGLVMFLAYGLMFLVTVQRMGQLSDVRRLLCWFALATVAMAALGIVQYLTSNGKFLWVYEHPFRSVRSVQGSFANGNHFCHLLALGVGPLVYCLITSLPQRSPGPHGRFMAGNRGRPLPSLLPAVWSIGLGVVLFAGLMSLSRGGFLVMATALLVIGAVYYRASLAGVRTIVSTVAVVTVVGSALFIYGYDRVVRELDDFAAMSVDELDKRSARRNLWLANGKSISGSPWVGRGVGSHREFYKIFMPNPFPLEYTHAESGYWQVASETGIAGFILLAAGLGLVASWSVSCMRNTTCRHTQAALGAVAAGLAASVVHAVWDFVWYIPATMSWTALLAGMACRLQQIPRARRASWGCDIRLARVGWVAITVLLAIVGAWMIRDRWSPALASRHWDNYLKKSQLSAEAGDRSAEDTLGDGTSEHAAAETWTAQMRADLETYLEYDRDYGRVHLRLAATYLREFHDAQRHATNPMDLSQIRDAAIASQFPSRAALNQWLDRAIGQHRMLLDKALWHARRALQLCPLQGEGYIYLAELCFLEGAPRSATSAYVAQALKVRPHEGQVLFLAGKEALLKSDLKSAVGYWRQSFHAGASHQRRLVRLLAGRLPVTFLLENIQPGLDAWESLFAEYERLGQPQPLRQLCDYYVALAEKKREGLTGTRAVRLWLTMHRRYRELNEQEAAYACIERAVASDPYNYLARLELAKAELQRGNLRDAETQFRWCLQQRPADRKAKSWLKKAVRLRVATSHWPDDSASDSRISDRH